MNRLDQSEIDELRAVLMRLEGRDTPDCIDHLEAIMVEKSLIVDGRVPNCSIEYLSIIGAGETLKAAAQDWIEKAREWHGRYEAMRLAS